MTAERWEQVEALFAAALERPAAERETYLLASCPDDPDLRAEVRALLDADDAASVYFHGLQSEAVPMIGLGEDPQVVGREIGPWRVLRELGRGGMGTVYLAERADGLYEQEVAVKLLRPGREAGETYHRFRAERQILASLTHPGIARLLGGGIMVREDSPDLPYLVMEYVEGHPIDVYCAEHGLGLRERVRLFLDVCRAVHYAHQNLVVHRDLKPSNVLVTADGMVKLLDFGIAKLLGPATSGATRTTHPLMTPGYASPEQVSGAPITTASDVYQLGLLLYKLLTGCRPYHVSRLSLSEFARVVLEQPPRRPSAVVGEEGSGTPSALSPASLRRALRGDVDAILLKALRKEPGARYTSVEALSNDLRRYLNGLPVGARRGTVGYRARKFLRRHWSGVALTALVLVAAVVAGTAHNARVAAERDRAAAAAATAEHVTDYLIGLFREDGASMTGTVGAREAALTLLEPAARRLKQDLADEPAARAELHRAFGEMFESLGRYDLAGTMLREAVALADSVASPFEAAAAHHDYGVFLGTIEGDREAAAAHLGRAVALRRTLTDKPGGDSKALAWSLLRYGQFLPGDHTDRDRLVAQGLDGLRQAYGPRSLEVGQALHQYYRKEAGTSGVEGAVAGLREAVAILMETAGPSLATAEALEDLGFMLEFSVEGASGLDLLRQAYEMNREATGPDGPRVLRMGANYGGALHRQGRHVEADSLFRALLSVAQDSPVEGRAGHGYVLFWHGRNLLILGHREEAIEVLRNAQNIWNKAYPEGHVVSRAIEQSLSQAQE